MHTEFSDRHGAVTAEHAFEFETDARGYEFCVAIALAMVEQFGITLREAVDRINRGRASHDLVGDDPVYQRSAITWALYLFRGVGGFHGTD